MAICIATPKHPHCCGPHVSDLGPLVLVPWCDGLTPSHGGRIRITLIRITSANDYFTKGSRHILRRARSKTLASNMPSLRMMHTTIKHEFQLYSWYIFESRTNIYSDNIITIIVNQTKLFIGIGVRWTSILATANWTLLHASFTIYLCYLLLSIAKTFFHDLSSKVGKQVRLISGSKHG